MESKLKKRLLEIEVALCNEEWDNALELYERLNKEWPEISKELTLDEAKEVLKIVDFLGKLLREKVDSFKKKQDYLKMRKSYSKFI